MLSQPVVAQVEGFVWSSFAPIGFALGQSFRDVRVFNNFADPESNDNTTPHPSLPGFTGAPMAIWKATVEWQSLLHGDGEGEHHAAQAHHDAVAEQPEPQAQGRQRAVLQRDLAAIVYRPELVRPGEGLADGGLLRPEIHRRPQPDLRVIGAGDELVHHANRVLHVREQDPLLENQPFDRIAPYGEARLEPEEVGRIYGPARESRRVVPLDSVPKALQDAVLAEVGDPRARVATIGPAGENLVRFACIANELNEVAGRTGMGAVMGSKKLKAIAVRGKTNVKIADQKGLLAVAKWVSGTMDEKHRAFHEFGTGAAMQGKNLEGGMPTLNYRLGAFDEVASARTVFEWGPGPKPGKGPKKRARAR